MVMPFENKAEGETQVRLLSPRKPSDYYDWMNPPNGPLWETQFWYDSPDESPFGTPTVPEDKYDPNWYEYRNITVTALIKYPSFENIDAIELDEHGEVPVTLFDAFVFSFTLDQWELLEAFRWNSIANQKLERGQYEHSSQSDAIDAIDDPQSRGSAMIARSSFFDNVDASTAPPLYEQYNTGRYSFREYEKLRTNPIKVTSGRPITYRIAQAIEDATDNPSFNTHETVEYHKAIALETFVGFTGFSFDFGSYSKAPEELLNRWFLNSQGEDADTGNCQDGTNLYCGIAAHLLDVNVGWVSCLARGVGHATAGVLDLQLPEEVFEVWDECPFGSGGEPFTLDTDYGDLHMVEATSPDPMIGWKLTASGQVELETYLPTASVQSHVPLNNDYEPAMDGTVRTGDSDPEIPWEYHKNHETLADVGG
ncbi:hypothetical protein BRD20_09130 [Halobacteriales archaeon SW_8_65_20]|nr:MAG: hypothetical protein BRD20_09130 [Halobacteriales archaeon SW_8_65_20]